jgi:hypothetical protein
MANVTVDGNIFITGAGPPTLDIGLFISAVTVTGGDVHILKTNASAIDVTGVVLRRGSMKLEDNVVLGLSITNNRVAQNLQVFKNQGGGKTVAGNVVGENLQCFDNEPQATFVGGPNAARKAEGQCFAGLPFPGLPFP